MMPKTPKLARLGLLLATCLLLASCNGPFVLIPGGQLEGPTEATPSDWGYTDEISTIQLETNPGDPYSVNIWAVAMDEWLYLHAGTNRTTWIDHIELNPLVRIAVDGTLYDVEASRVKGPEEFDRFADAYEAKYGTRPRNENIDEIFVYRLGAR